MILKLGIPKPEFRTPSGVYSNHSNWNYVRQIVIKSITRWTDQSRRYNRHKYTAPIEISKEVMLEQPVYSNYKTSPLRDGFSFEAEDVKKGVTVTAASYINGYFGEPISYTYILDAELFSASFPLFH